MQEKRTEVDLQNEFLQQAYAGFKELAQKYGKLPSEGMDTSTNGRVFNQDIPNDTNLHKHPDFIGGRYFGPDAGTVQIFYRHKDVATQVILSKNSHGKVTIDQSVLFELIHVKTGYTLHRHYGENLEPDINSLNELISKAKAILIEDKKHHEESFQLSSGQKETRMRIAINIASGRKAAIRIENAKKKNGRK